MAKYNFTRFVRMEVIKTEEKQQLKQEVVKNTKDERIFLDGPQSRRKDFFFVLKVTVELSKVLERCTLWVRVPLFLVPLVLRKIILLTSYREKWVLLFLELDLQL